MKRLAKGISVAAMVVLMGGAALFAAPAETEGTAVVETTAEMKGDRHHKMPEPPKADVITGTIKVSEKKDVRTVTLTTKDGKTYTLTNTGFNRPAPNPDFAKNMEKKGDEKRPEGERPEWVGKGRCRCNKEDCAGADDKVIIGEDGDKGVRKPGPRGKGNCKGPGMRPGKGPRPMPIPFEKVSMDSLAAKKGKSLTVTGFLNKESGVFTVIAIGNIYQESVDNSNAK